MKDQPSTLNHKTLLKGATLFVIGFISAILIARYFALSQTQVSKAPKTIDSNDPLDCEVNSIRRTGFEYTKPLLYVEKTCESPLFQPIKTSLTDLINELKISHDLSTVSIYLREFEHSNWMVINNAASFHPGSLTKVPLMISYLHESETQPSLLDREYDFVSPPAGTLPVQNYKSFSIEPGKKYKVRDLLRYMIVDSDNNSTWLLSEKLGLKDYNKTFQNLGVNIPIPDPEDNDLRLSAREFSVFMRTLYNSSYLIPENSEYALQLLSHSTFDKGMVAGLPEGTKVVHKFAEWDNGKDFELHESGIIYTKGKAFLLTVMSRGKNRDKLPGALAAISKKVYYQMVDP